MSARSRKAPASGGDELRVAVRVRPFNTRETGAGASKLCVAMDGKVTTITDTTGIKAPRSFTYDYSYWSHDGYVLFCLPLGASALEGAIGFYAWMCFTPA
jgi:hypothetical protein